MLNTFISIVIPCYNEERNLRLGALEKVTNFLKKKTYTWEVLIVDDGSTDESRRLIKDFIRDNSGFILLENRHQGKALTVISGIESASGDFILFTDMDQATPISEIDRLLPYTKNDYDLVIGSRNSQRRGAPLLRLAMARGFMILRNIILDLNIKDTQCGFKLFSERAAKDILNKMNIYKVKHEISGATVTAGFDVEILFVAQKLGYKIKEVPVEWHYQETRRINPVMDSIQGLQDLISIRLNSLKGIYG